jgi:hypothetical protein
VEIERFTWKSADILEIGKFFWKSADFLEIQSWHIMGGEKKRHKRKAKKEEPKRRAKKKSQNHRIQSLSLRRRFVVSTTSLPKIHPRKINLKCRPNPHQLTTDFQQPIYYFQKKKKAAIPGTRRLKGTRVAMAFGRRR